MDIYFLIFLIFIVAPFSTLIHELGHAYAAKTKRAKSIVLTIGSGKQLLSLTANKIQIRVCSIFFVGGVTASVREKPYTKGELCWIACLGPVTNVVFACILYLIQHLYTNQYLQLFYFYNLWLGLANFIPFKLQDKHTDGYAIYKVLTEKHTPMIY